MGFKQACTKRPSEGMESMRKIPRLLVLPFVLFIWLIGWTAAYFGERARSSQSILRKVWMKIKHNWNNPWKPTANDMKFMVKFDLFVAIPFSLLWFAVATLHNDGLFGWIFAGIFVPYFLFEAIDYQTKLNILRGEKK
jgi:hypothetical protein